MGLIQAAVGAIGGVLGDQWKEFIYCDSMPANILMTKGHRRTGSGSSNRGDDNIISNGSGIAVNNGQCMIIVESGKVVDICAEPGNYTYDRSTEPSLFTGGDLATNIHEIFNQIGRRFTYGGDTGKDQRVYYINTKEILGNKYGTPQPVGFKIRDDELRFSQTIQIRCFGEYSYRITNPILFYTNLAGNVADSFDRSEIDSQLKSDLLSALQPALAKVSAMRIGYDELAAHTMEIGDAVNEVLSKKWGETRGIQIASLGVSSVSLSEESQKVLEKLQDLQAAAVLGGNVALQNGLRANATADAMRTAAGNEGGMGAAMGFVGMNMAAQAGYGMGMAQPPAQQQPQQPVQPAQPAAASQGAPGAWTCAACGHAGNTGKFCEECGKGRPKPAVSAEWTCSCGHAGNTGKFCSECGKPRPDGPWVCSCGASNTGKFCQNCGKPRA